MSSILQHQLTLGKVIKVPVCTGATILPSSTTLSPILMRGPDTTTTQSTSTLQISAVDPLERFCADPVPMTAQKLSVGSADNGMPTDSNQNNSNDKISNSSINVKKQKNKCFVSNEVDQIVHAFDTSNYYSSVHVLPILVDMHSFPNGSQKVSAPLERSQSYSEAVGDVDHIYASNSDHTNKQLVKEKLSSSTDLNETGQHANTYQWLTKHIHSHFEHDFKKEATPIELITHHQQQQQQQYAQTNEIQNNNEVILSMENDSIKTEHLTVNSKLKGGTDSSFNITAFSHSSGGSMSVSGAVCVTSGDTNVVEADTRTNIPALDVLLNDGLSKNRCKHLSPSEMRLAQASTSVVAVQKNIGLNAVTVSQEKFPPPKDCMVPVNSSTFLYEKESQLLAKLFATDLVIPKCYTSTSSYHVDTADNGELNKSGNRLQHSNDMLDNASKEKHDVDTSVPSVCSTLPTTEATKQFNVSNTAFNLFAEILLRQQDYQHKLQQQQSQLHTADANNIDIASDLQTDQLHMNKLSTAPQLSAPLALPFPFELPLPLSLSLPLPLPLPLSLPLMPIIDNTKNNNSSLSKHSTFEVPAFLIGDSTGECKDQYYLKSNHDPSTHHEHQQEVRASPLQQHQASNHLLATQFLYSRLLRANVPALADYLRERDLYMIDYAPNFSKLHTPASAALPLPNDSNNNRNHFPNDNSDSVDTNSLLDTVSLSPIQKNAYQSSTTSNLPTEISSADKRSRVMTNINSTSTNLSGTELLSAQEAALKQAQIQLNKYLGLSNQFVELTQKNLTTSDKLTSHVIPRVRENMQKSKQFIDSTQAQLSLLRRQCASAKFCYERTMRRLYTSESKYLSQLHVRQKPSTYSSSWCANNTVSRTAVIAAMAAASELQPLPAITIVKTENSISGKSEPSDSECERALDTRQTTLEIETGIERYIKMVCKNSDDAEANEISSNDFDIIVEPGCDDNYVDTKTPVYSSHNRGNNNDRDFELECNVNVKRVNKQSAPFMVGGNANKRLLETSSPICFWHPNNRGLSVNKGALSAAEIVLEYSALSVQADMQDSPNLVNTMAGESVSTPTHECERGRIVEKNSERTATDGETYQGLLLRRGVNTRLGSYNGDHNAGAIMDGCGKKKEIQPFPVSEITHIGSPMASNATNSPTMLTPTSTPTSTPTPPLNTSAANIGKNRRKANNGRHLESTISFAATAAKLTPKNAIFNEQSSLHTLRQRWSSNNGGDIANNNTSDINMGNKIESSKELEILQVLQATSEAIITPSVVLNIGHKKKHQQHKQQQYILHQPQQQQAPFNSRCSSNNDNNNAIGSGSDCLYGLHGPSANNTSETTAAAVVALQERAFTDIFKARFNALTAAAVMNATVGISAAADGPYDLSISRKAKQT